MKLILVVNSGSSSVKYQFFQSGTYEVIASGMLDRIGEPVSSLKHRWINEEGTYSEIEETQSV